MDKSSFECLAAQDYPKPVSREVAMFSDDKWVMVCAVATSYLALVCVLALLDVIPDPLVSGGMGAVSALVGYGARQAYLRCHPGKA